MIEFNKEKLFSVMQDFYRVTNARIAIFDEWFNELMGYPEKACKLCNQIRETSFVKDMCKISDATAFKKAQETKSTILYQCKMGLYESVSPIIVNEKIIGYIMIGQIITLEAKKIVEENIKNFVADNKKALEILDLMPHMTKDKLLSSSHIMMVCTEHLCIYREIRNRKNRKLKQIESFISENLHTKLTVDVLSRQFNMSRASLFALFKDSFGEGITRHINSLKIEKAKTLLGNGVSYNDILAQIGITDSNYFWRMFKKATNMTVKDYLFELSQKNYLNKDK